MKESNDTDVHPVTRILEERRAHIGEEYVTDWVRINQIDVDVFGAVTRNVDPMHNDPIRARETGVWGGHTVLHGLYTASLLPHFLIQVPGGHFATTESAHTVNYGIDSLRWMAPIQVGTPIRARVTLKEITKRSENQYLAKYYFHVEQEGKAGPCMTATNLVLIVGT